MNSPNTSANTYLNNRVGPVMRAGELAVAVAEAAIEDNPGKEVRVDDKRAYLRIDTDDEMILRRETIERALGRPFKMNELEVDLSSFAGRIETRPDQVRFYFTKHLST
ncbi:MAG: MmoB/DmpM family protein [Burkholderiales bacterium]|nr:MmoB/DmpM family protein [Burkholderiales bacterium]